VDGRDRHDVRLGSDAAEALLGARERAVRDRVREIVAAEVAPRAAEVDRESRFPEAGYRALAQAGLAGLLISPRHGGSGDTMLAYAAALEEISAGCGATSTVYMTQMHCAHPILVAGDDAQRERLLPGLCSGAVGALVSTALHGGAIQAEELRALRSR
jgi:alkylation response protein AidB-like acyl-CoA dehydrogenase